MFSNNRAVNILAGARIFLFASRDVWFVVGLPVFLYNVVGWNFWQVGVYLAVWVIGYGIVQASAPRFVRRRAEEGGEPDGRTAAWLAFALAALPAGIAIALSANADPTAVVVVGLIIFGVVFAMNSAVHSYLILSYADNDKVAMNVGFYYMANAVRTIGRDGPLGPPLSVERAERVPLGLSRVRRGRRAPLTDAPDQERPAPTPGIEVPRAEPAS